VAHHWPGLPTSDSLPARGALLHVVVRAGVGQKYTASRLPTTNSRRLRQGNDDITPEAGQKAVSSQIDGIRGMLEALMHPPAGAPSMLNLAGPRRAEGSAAAGSGSGGSGSATAATLPADAPNPARSLMGAIAKGVMLQQEKERRQVCM